jgi:hypothetical protein
LNDAMLERNLRSGARLLLKSYDGWLRAGAQDYLSRVASLSAPRMP